MYVRRLAIENVRSIGEMAFEFAKGHEAGWHVILGANGAGKSTVIRSLALALVGPHEAAALRQNWTPWLRSSAPQGQIRLEVGVDDVDAFSGEEKRSDVLNVGMGLQSVESGTGGQRVELTATEGQSKAERALWGTNLGWFSASFGPFRRFAGGDQALDRLFQSNPRLAPHLSAFGEDVALTEGLRWLRDLHVKSLEARSAQGVSLAREPMLLDALVGFINRSALLPNGARIEAVRSDDILIRDGAGYDVAVDQMSDGYRSILSMMFEVLRQMTQAYGIKRMLSAFDSSDRIDLPGVVAIDEVDAHLHPSWQKDIGPWFTRYFPRIQFIVTTHSPIVCRNATSVWHLPAPGTREIGGRVEGTTLDRLIYGSILDAYGTDFFGSDVARSEQSKAMLQELATLNRFALRGDLNPTQRQRMEELRKTLPTRASDTASL